MQLLILIIPDNRKMEQILVKMMEAGIRGGSLLECEGALQAVGQSGLKKPPVFSSLEQYLKPDTGNGKMLLAAMDSAQIEATHRIVNEVTGGLGKANTGVFLTLPLGFVDGVRGQAE